MTFAEQQGQIPDLDEISSMGAEIYEGRLKAILEPDMNGKFVAIHVDTGDYTVGRSSAVATREMHRLHPHDTRLLVMKVGPEPEYGLAARILAGEMLSGKQK